MPERPPEEPVSSAVTEHVRAIVRAAEDVADAMKREAEQRAAQRLREADAAAERRLREADQEAERLLADRRRLVAESSEAILDRARSVLAQLDEAAEARARLEALLGALDVAAGELDQHLVARHGGVEAGGSGDAGDAERGADGHEPVRARDEEEGLATEPVTPRSPGAAHERFGAAHEVARQMAGAGSSRSEVATHLQRTFGLTDPHEVLNEAFPESDVRA